MLFWKKEDRFRSYEINNKPIFFYCDPKLNDIADFFANILKSEDASLNILKENNTIQIGWGFYSVVKNKKGLQIVAYDIEKNPFHDTTDDLSTSMKIFNEQCSIINRIGARPVETTLKNTLIVHKRALGQPKVYFQRQNPSDAQDSGWYMGAIDKSASNAPTDYAKAYTYQLYGICRDALGIMQLPIGTIAVFDHGRLVEIVDKDNNKIL